MFRSAGECSIDNQEEDRGFSFGRGTDAIDGGTTDVNEQYAPELYSANEEALADIDNIADEVEVEHSVATEWDTTTSNDVNKSFTPVTIGSVQVHLTNDALRSRPHYFVGNRNSTDCRGSNSLQWEDPSDIPGTSSSSQCMPAMKSLFKMYGEAALRKAEQTDLLRKDDLAEKGEEAFLAPLPCREELVVDEDEGYADFVAVDAGQFYSKRKNFVNKSHEWPLYCDKPVDFQEACHILTGAILVHESKICTSIPQGFRGEGTFVINCEHLLQQCDSNNDGLGSWGRPTGRNRYYGHSNGAFTRMDDGRGNLLPNAKYIWKCMMRRYEHPLTANVAGGQNRFIKKVYSALYPPERKDVVPFVVLTYEWIGKPFDFRVDPYFAKNHRVDPIIPRPPAGSKDWQAASFQGGPMTALPTNYSAYFGDCPLYAIGAIDFNTVASIILGGTVVDSSKYYKIDSNTGDAVRVDRACKLIEGAEYDVQILSKRYEHPSVNGRFVRKIYTARSPTNIRPYESCMSLAVMTYFWKGEPEYFEAGPQRRVRMSEGVEKQRSLDTHYRTHSDQKYFTDHARIGIPPPVKRARKEEEELGSSSRAALYRTEYELQERQAALLDRLEAFMDRLERFIMYLPQPQVMQQIWLNGAPHGDGSAATHEEEIIVEDETYNEDYVSNLADL